jgi:hypothetical protein
MDLHRFWSTDDGHWNLVADSLPWQEINQVVN